MTSQRTDLSHGSFPGWAQVIVWVVGEYGAVADGGPAAALTALGRLAEEGAPSDHVRGYLLTALAKLAAQVPSLAPLSVWL